MFLTSTLFRLSFNNSVIRVEVKIISYLQLSYIKIKKILKFMINDNKNKSISTIYIYNLMAIN